MRITRGKTATFERKKIESNFSFTSQKSEQQQQQQQQHQQQQHVLELCEATAKRIIAFHLCESQDWKRKPFDSIPSPQQQVTVNPQQTMLDAKQFDRTKCLSTGK